MTRPKVSDNFGAHLGETARAWRNRLNQRLKPLGLSQAKWLVLLKLSHGGDGMVQKELAERIGVEGPTLVGLLDRMTRDGWIVRRDSRADRRSKTVHLTEQANAVTREIEAVAAKLRRELLADIPAEQLQCCQDVLQRIRNKAERV
ncbi:MAG: MarR family winged helix-turn-helix transcriptional regulator [Gammaproteobacteria bacterium]|nr:MarR family transcriptional regulator [Gammaproteobacteria bacterium]